MIRAEGGLGGISMASGAVAGLGDPESLCTPLVTIISYCLYATYALSQLCASIVSKRLKKFFKKKFKKSSKIKIFNFPEKLKNRVFEISVSKF